MLTNAQALLIKAEINADVALSSQSLVGDGPNNIAVALNAPPAVALSVWRTNVGVQEFFDQINWSIYTPADALDDVALALGLNAERAIARMMSIQTKQFNLQTMLNRPTLDMSKVNIRAGIQDAVVQVPSGAAGAMRAPGGAQGAAVLGVCVRAATRAEKVLALNAGALVATGTVSAAVLGFEGLITAEDVTSARNAA